MMEFYPQIKLLHVVTALTSGCLFLLLNIGGLGGKQWGRMRPVRFISYGIDSVLLSAAIMLLAILPSAVFANRWLWMYLGVSSPVALLFYEQRVAHAVAGRDGEPCGNQ